MINELIAISQEAVFLVALERPDVFVAGALCQVVGNAISRSDRIGERQLETVAGGRNRVAVFERRGIEDNVVANGNDAIFERDCLSEGFLSRSNRPILTGTVHAVLVSERNHAIARANLKAISRAVVFVGVDGTFLSPTCNTRANAHEAVSFAQGHDILLTFCLLNVAAENQIVLVVVGAEFDYIASRNANISECRRFQRNCLAVGVNLDVSLDRIIARSEARSGKFDCGVSKVEFANSLGIVDHRGGQALIRYNKARSGRAGAFVSEDAAAVRFAERGYRGIVIARCSEFTDCELIIVALAVVGDCECGVRLEAVTQNRLIAEGDSFNRINITVTNRDIVNVNGLEGSISRAND